MIRLLLCNHTDLVEFCRFVDFASSMKEKLGRRVENRDQPTSDTRSRFRPHL
jgi:hypothetical protein